MKKRILTMMLALCVMFTSVPADANLFAQETGQTQSDASTVPNTEQNGIGDANSQGADGIDGQQAQIPTDDKTTENTESTESVDSTQMPEQAGTEAISEEGGSTETVNPDTTETTEPTEGTEAAEPTEGTEAAEPTEDTESTEMPEPTETTEIPEETESTEVQEAELNFVMVESDYLQTPGTQNIVASIGTEDMKFENPKLIYQNMTDGSTHTAGANAIVQDMMLFSLNFTDAAQTGAYQLSAIEYEINGTVKRIDLSASELDARFGVNTKTQTAPDERIIDENVLAEGTVDADVVTIGEDGELLSETTVKDVLNNGTAELGQAVNVKGANGKMVVVLDPGHDASHSGAHANGAAEETLVLKIAQYCKQELETYSGVTVYMTRSIEACPYGGSGVSSGDCNVSRVNYASSVKANVYVSFHLNSNTSAAPNGVGVYYPNGNYNASVGSIGKGLAGVILNKLIALGLKQWSTGTIVWNATNDKYPDGSAADYLGVIRNCKLVGIPAVLIEHAFISNASDYNGYLSSEGKLKALGVADATAIAEAYGLKKKANTDDNNSTNTDRPVIAYTQSRSDGNLGVKWNELQGVAYYEVYRSTEMATGYAKLGEAKNATEYMDSTAVPGKKYYYTVRAVFTNNKVSGMSDPVAGRQLAAVALSYAKSKSSKKIELGWNKVTGAAGYYIYRENPATGAYEQIDKVTSGKTVTFVDSVPSNNKNYTYKVCAYNTSNGTEGVGANSVIMSAKAIAKGKITAIIARNSKTLEIQWKQVKGAEGYEIARSTKADGTYKVIGTVSGGGTLSYQDKKVKAEKTYYYKVQAINSANGQKGEGGFSAVVSGKTIASAEIASVKSKNETTIEIKWNKVASASGYKVKRSTSKSGTYKVIKTIDSKDTTSYQDKKVTKGKTYYYKIETLVNNNGKTGSSGESKAVKGKTVAKPVISYVVSSGSKTLEIGWNSVSGAWGYRVKRSTSKSGTYETIATLEGADKTTYKDKKATTGKTYYYKVEAINKVNGDKGYSGNSKAVSGKTLATVSLSSVEAEDSKTINLTWKKVSGASGYEIYRSTSKNGKYKQVAKVSGGRKTSYKDKTVSAGKTYYYKVRAYKNSDGKIGRGTFSGAKKVWTLKQVVITGTSGTAGNAVTLKWAKVSKSGGYRVYRSTKADTGFKLVKEVTSADKLSYKDTGVKAGKVYYYRIAAYAKSGGKEVSQGSYSATLRLPVLGASEISSITLQENNSFLLEWNPVKNAEGYQLAIAYQENGEYETLAKLAGTSCIQEKVTPGTTYYYKVRAYAGLSNGKTVYGDWSTVKVKTAAYEIMGNSTVTVAQMVSYYNSKYQYPSAVYAQKGAATPNEFFQILVEETTAEGVRAEVLFAQVILETGGLQFGGDVRAEQCNFGGIGAVGNGAAGETFADVRTGLRAQTQHLKAYASTAPLNYTCVDPRFQYVTRGCAEYVEWLSIPQNPYGKGWATDPNYGTKLLAIISNVKKL